MSCTHPAVFTFTVHQGSLIRGDDLKEPQGAIHEQGFRHFTVKKLEKLHKKNINFMVERGQHGQFMKRVCVHPPFKGSLHCGSNGRLSETYVFIDQGQ